MKRINKLIAIAMMMMMMMSAALVQAQSAQKKSTQPQPSASANPVTGSGTPGQITKWAGTSGTNSYVVGDSVISEDKFGKVGIGTTTPTSLLTISGMVETTLGGYKFPDGTVQTTAALSSIFHDATLSGNGTVATPLGIAPGGVGTNQLANNSVTASKIAAGQVVKSLNGFFDNVQLVAGSNITITPNGNTLTIAAPGGAIVHDATLSGIGTAAMPLGIAVPLSLTGSSPVNLLTISNVGDHGNGIQASGANSGNLTGGAGVNAAGGSSTNNKGGNGVNADGGQSQNFDGGVGVSALGGLSLANGAGGIGVSATGGSSQTVGGEGLQAMGGIGNSNGGIGVGAIGGIAFGAGHFSGTGILALAGPVMNGATAGPAGYFQGNVTILGNLSKSGGSFKIDHPLDPENKYLYHSFVESPDMMNIYNGNVTTDGNGDAVIEMPTYFEALNRDFRYQVTVIGTFAQAIVADEIKGNRFTIKTNAPNVKVSWQVTGVRQDAFANKNRIPVEVDKSEAERGHYLHPDAFDQPEEKSILMVQHPEILRQIKEVREKAPKEKLQ